MISENSSGQLTGVANRPDGSTNGAPKFAAASVLTVAAAHALHDTFQGLLPPLLPTFIAILSLSKAEAGLLAALLDLPSLLQPFIGHWADRVNLRYLVFLGPAVTAVMMSLIGIAPSLGVLALLLTLAGLSRAGFHAVGPVAAGQLSGRWLGRGMGLWMVGGRLGPTLGPILAVTTVQLLGLRRLPWLMVLGLVGSGLLYSRLKDVTVRPSRVSQDRLAWRTLAAMAPLMLPVAAIVTIRSFMSSGLMAFLPVYLTEGGAGLWFVGAAVSVLQGAGTLGVLLAGALSDLLGRRSTLLIAFVTAPLFMLLLLRVSGWAQIPVLFLLGLTSSSAMPVFMALVQESFPEDRALANGLYLALTFVIQSLSAIVVGALGDRFGLHWTFTASAAILPLALPILWLLPGRSDPRPGQG
jgi:FSR family fosmidomycin resistance protein-like MFS transporter